ncbi:MAG: DnaJ domain-containing protein [Pseudomonadota bacterium]
MNRAQRNKRKTLYYNEPPRRDCDWPGCEGHGEFRAPKDRKLKEYYLFCLEHVREYNKSWDYFSGMKEGDIEDQIRSDSRWQRPTWRFGRNRAAKRPFDFKFNDGFGFFNEDGEQTHHGPGESARAKSQRDTADAARRAGKLGMPDEQQQAMATLDLGWPFSKDELKRKYKALSKKHHPDANGGDKASEERFKVISAAYASLMGYIRDLEARVTL